MNLTNLSDRELREAYLLQERLANLKKQEVCQDKFLDFINNIWPEFICGRHHKIFAQKYENTFATKKGQKISHHSI